jgi:radical SAM protein with 4Fe4S-binding SPASM domain
MNRRRPSGWANPRARPFVGWRYRRTQIQELLGARIGQRRARRNEGSLIGGPPIVQIQTKSGCNGECVICPQKKIRNMFPETEMSGELFHRIIEQCAVEKNLRGVGFVLQNEPLTDPGIFDKIRLFRDRVSHPAMTFLVTNGILLTRDAVPALFRSGLDAVHITCNGYGREDYEAINRGKSWETFKENLDYFLAQDLSRIAVMLSFVRHRLYQKELAGAVSYWRSRGFRSFIHGINNRGGLVDDYETYARPLSQESFPIRLRKMVVKKALRCCPYPFLQMSILAEGKVLICTHDWARRMIIGDLSRETIRGVWNGPAMREIRLKHLSGRAKEIPSCEKCDVFENAAFG